MSIIIENLRLKYPDAKEKIFDDLSIKIEQNEKILLVGPSGSGKSTLLNVMGKLIPKVIDIPMKHEVLETAENGAFVFQDPDSQFTMPTIAEELAFILENRNVPRDDMDEQFEAVLQTVGLNVDLNMRIHQLSGGMKQKLAIASTLLQQADTLFLDEPTSMLDAQSARHLWDTIVNVWQDKTVIIVEHRVEFIWDIVDRIVMMNHNGEIIYIGTPEETLNKHINLLDEFGIWHPRSWEKAPVFNKIKEQDETVLTLEDMAVTRGKKQIVHIDKLNINKGEWITLEGENGSGKTSILLSLMKLIKHEGAVYYKDKFIKKTKDYKGKVFPVFQNPELQFMTNNVLNEVSINFERTHEELEAKQIGLELLERFGLEHLKDLHPLEISVGQKRRLSVTTAITQTPEVILFDEPTFGLDRNNTFKLLELFDELVRSGITIIMITHDEEIKKRYPSRRLLIDNKSLIEVGDVHV
ncbi:ABC transporter ATP-binding protein [Aliicoccus persicus]|uniref:Energy-coupling factor transport system ATP-binding protein n=1 Tax=Aliicoccus persicus TaxID=930138 RepID=A0A662Z1Z9_9STAP|nr:ATP-binding cassette domain-containing protein [Aliicoccus persicus]SEV82138.1 energy-coupling factor transport system ATP-binding protein [Aliicoccus persicus]